MKMILSDTIRSDFSRGDESWKSFEGEQECTDDCNPVKADGINKNIGVQDVSGAPSGVYFLAPGTQIFQFSFGGYRKI